MKKSTLQSWVGAWKELKQWLFPSSDGVPSGAKAGAFWYDTTAEEPMWHDGTGAKRFGVTDHAQLDNLGTGDPHPQYVLGTEIGETVCPLENGAVPSRFLPGSYNEVQYYATLSAFPVVGDPEVVYVARDTRLTYMWGGSSYVVISPSLALGETSSTAYRGDRGATAFAHSQQSGNPHGTAIGDISGLQGALDGKAATVHSHTFSNISDGESRLTKMAEALRSNGVITGGGQVIINTATIRWTSRMIVISNGRGAHFSTGGFFEINTPASGTALTGVGGSSNRTWGTNGASLAVWEALYYILPIGSGTTSVPANFRVCIFNSDIEIPENWVLIALNNQDASAFFVNVNGGYLQTNNTTNDLGGDGRGNVGGGNRGVYMLNGRPTAMGSTVGSATQPVYMNAGTITAITGAIANSTTGNAATATKLATLRNIALTGDVSGSANFDGSADISITATVTDDSHSHTAATLPSSPLVQNSAGYGQWGLVASPGLKGYQGLNIYGSHQIALMSHESAPYCGVFDKTAGKWIIGFDANGACYTGSTYFYLDKGGRNLGRVWNIAWSESTRWVRVVGLTTGGATHSGGELTVRIDCRYKKQTIYAKFETDGSSNISVQESYVDGIGPHGSAEVRVIASGTSLDIYALMLGNDHGVVSDVTYPYFCTIGGTVNSDPPGGSATYNKSAYNALQADLWDGKHCVVTSYASRGSDPSTIYFCT